MLDLIAHFLSAHALFFDLGLLGIGLFAGKFKELAIFFRVTLILVKIAQWYFKTHPTGRKIARETNHDEELQDIYNKHLKKYDITPQKDSKYCLGRGETTKDTPLG